MHMNTDTNVIHEHERGHERGHGRGAWSMDLNMRMHEQVLRLPGSTGGRGTYSLKARAGIRHSLIAH